MNIYYWTSFYKRRNSTKQPASAGTQVNVLMKEPCSFYNPVIQTSTIPKTANYFKIPSGVFTLYDAYYFVSDVVSLSNSITEFHLTIDRAATFKTDIKASYNFVERAADTTKRNQWLTDPLNTPTNSLTIQRAKTTLQHSAGGTLHNLFNLAEYNFILCVVGTPSSTLLRNINGISKAYVCSPTTLNAVAIALNNNNFLSQLVNEITNPLESIIRCHMIPIDMTGLAPQSEPIFFGSYSSTIVTGLLTQRLIVFESALNLPTWMQSAQDYTRFSPYATATIFLPCIGVVPLDVDIMTGKTLTLRTIVDVCSGDIVYELKDATPGYDYVYATYSGNCATEVPVSGGNFSALGVTGGAITTAGGLITANPAIALGGALAMAKSIEVHTQHNGAISSGAGPWMGTEVVVTAYYRDPAHGINDHAPEEGVPVEKRDMIGNYAGFVKCRDATVDMTGTLEDKQAIEQMLNEGMFIE